MPVEINWGLATQQPNFTNGFLQSYEAGKAIGRQQRADNAFAMLQANPNDPKAQQEAAVYNPQAYNAFANQQAMQRAAQARQAAGDVVRAYGAPGYANDPRQVQAEADAGGYTAEQGAAVAQQRLNGTVPPNLDPAHPAVQGVGAAAASGQISPTEAMARLFALDPEMGDKMVAGLKNMDDLRRSKLAESSDALANAAFNLKSVPPEQRLQAAMAMMPQLAAHGVTPQMIQGADLSDQGLNGIIGQSLGVKGMVEMAQKDREFGLKEQEMHKGVAQTVTNADGTTTTRLVDPITGQEIGTGVAGEGGGPASGGGGAGQPRSVRNNNPGNLRASGFTQSQPGYKGADSAGYAIFATPEQGAAAQAALLGGKGYFGGGRTTVQSIVEKWAPRASRGGDNTDAQVNNYIGYVARQLGVSPTQPLTREQLPAMAAAMARFESGATGKAGSVRVPQAQGGGSTLTGNNAGGNGGLSDQGVTLAAVEYLKTGKMPAGMGRTGAASRAVISKAAEIAAAQGATPEDIVSGRVAFKADAMAQQQTLVGFTKGKQGDTVRSLNVAIDHLRQMSAAAEALQNGNIQLFNSISQNLARATGSKVPTNFDTLRKIVSTEVVKAVAGSSGGVTDREEMMSILSKAQSPEQLAGAIEQVKGLMRGQLKGLAQQYTQGTGRGDFNRFLEPETAKELGFGQKAKAPPSVGTVVRGWRFKGGDPAQQSNWEKAR